MRRAAGGAAMSAASSSTAAFFFVIALGVMLALMLFAVFRLPEWQPATAEGGGGPLLPPVPAPPVPAQAGPSLFQTAEAAGTSQLPRRTAPASWADRSVRPAGVAPAARHREAVPLGRPSEAGPLGGPGEAIPLGEHGRLGEPALPGEAGPRPGDHSYAARRDREQLEQATVGRVVVPGSPPWEPAPKPHGIP
jgi:hypothetical protein